MGLVSELTMIKFKFQSLFYFYIIRIQVILSNPILCFYLHVISVHLYLQAACLFVYILVYFFITGDESCAATALHCTGKEK